MSSFGGDGMNEQISTDQTVKEPPIPISEKYLLTIKEAGAYFNIGTKKMRRLAEDNPGAFSVQNGNRYLVIRPKFEEFLCRTSSI